MKVIYHSLVRREGFTGIIIEKYCGDICFYKNGKIHNENGTAVQYTADGQKGWYYKGKYYGADNDFTKKTWKRKVKQLKREEELQIFL